MKPLVSIIIPTFNEEKNLENTLKAIGNQDYKKYELIVSDSRSKDNTRKIAKKYGAQIVVDGRKGIGAGRNLGGKFAKGDILLFVDADTVLMMNAVSEFVKTIAKRNVVGATCPILPIRPSTKNLVIYLTYNSFVKASIRTRKPQIGGMCIAVKTNKFREIGGFDESLHAFEDVDLTLRLGRLGRIAFNENTCALTSPRRIEAWGYFAAFRRYFKLSIKYLVGRKIKMNEYKPVR